MAKDKTPKNVLEVLFDASVNQCSPIIDDYSVVIKLDENGKEVPVIVKEDTAKVIEENGMATDWSIQALLRSGINPNSMSVQTGYNTRLEGINELGSVETSVEDFLASQTTETEE